MLNANRGLSDLSNFPINRFFPVLFTDVISAWRSIVVAALKPTHKSSKTCIEPLSNMFVAIGRCYKRNYGEVVTQEIFAYGNCIIYIEQSPC